ncbi:hypothetical protein QWT69_01425 [Sporosarcina oncorhynchi]|uniref:Uncharacterized protein n=1 Tax=Sporosarcina oncorhynchi TaxID=3056444 RepID=A0ABZ0L5Q2_9BACL|nr:hypothetical protein [Sporosarcina sp. T2O-4]WOV87810.1 hypothetical protein QWT69_01425 [Sporosarcina sp. T2O-4]
MQEKRPRPDQEMICINVDKVYDWVMKENSFEYTPRNPIKFPCITTHLSDQSLEDAIVTCEVTPVDASYDPVVILDRQNREFMIDGRTVLLQELTIRKRFKLVIVLTLPDCTVHRSHPIYLSRSEQVVLCAPEETTVTVTYTDLKCFVSSTGRIYQGGPNDRDEINFSNLVVTISTCQSIQSTYPVTVEFLAEYCHPRAELEIASCSLPTRPASCNAVFPD